MALRAIIVAVASLALLDFAVVPPEDSGPEVMGPPAHMQNTAQQPTTSPSRQDATANEIKYDAFLRAARAFCQLGEDAKAVDAYLQAILAAPNKNSCDIARTELAKIASISNHINRSFLKWVRIVVYWSMPVFVVLFLGMLIWIAGLVVRIGSVKIAIRSSDAGFPAGYLEQAIRAVFHDFKTQHAFAASIVDHSTASAAPTPRGFDPSSVILVQSLEAISLAQGWTSILSNLPVNIYRRTSARFFVCVQLLRTEKHFGVSVRLLSRSGSSECWRHVVPADRLAETIADVAYNIVVFILDERERSR